MARQTALGSQRTVSLLLTQRRCSALVLWLVHICRASSTEGDPLRHPLRTLSERRHDAGASGQAGDRWADVPL